MEAFVSNWAWDAMATNNNMDRIMCFMRIKIIGGGDWGNTWWWVLVGDREAARFIIIPKTTPWWSATNR